MDIGTSPGFLRHSPLQSCKTSHPQQAAMLRAEELERPDNE